MSNFETDNQDKDNLVGDARVMSDAVDVEQDRLALIDEVRELNEQVEMLKGMVGILEVPDDDSKEWQSMKEKAKAWDYLNHLINECRSEELTIAIKPHHNIKQFYIIDDIEKGGVYDSYNVFDKITVNSALKNINDVGG